jgi:hypothetical protein
VWARCDKVRKLVTGISFLLAPDKGRQRSASLLLENGADVLTKTDEGKAAIALAVDEHHVATLGQLIQMAERIDESNTQKVAHIACNKAKLRLDTNNKISVDIPRMPALTPPESQVTKELNVFCNAYHYV